MTDHPKVLDSNWKSRRHEPTEMRTTAQRLADDGHNELADSYRARGAALAEAYQALATIGRIARDSAKNIPTAGTEADQQIGVDLVGWLIAYGWTPPEEFEPLLVSDEDEDEAEVDG
ncbi:hypothetical protein KNU39_gp74 [Gordonia phage Mutzi]|uniref:Uncharacterized protein n=1 Tax=Gordonia phage Mutzi TaxID=2500789 RepID=A0A411AXS0_9CAUD|nr:hypothetical protein KNU39_gp74 [Gordonia phage Mutzi]QAX92884.1 hypothetical protein SEA_MUTZI_74 [Gordonia phage Mutzi]QWY84761.1 hypothetical protein SEA_YUNGMONEY_75 [Gordonia phage YungMoney]